MQKILFAMLCTLQIASCLDAAIHSIRATTANNFTSELWETTIQQCFNGNKESCKMLLHEKLKTKDDCKAKTECVLIGEILWHGDSKQKSLPFFEKACNAKNTHGCYFLGLYHNKQEDFVKAKDFFQKACLKKNISSCFELGSLYENGNGMRQDYQKASELYKKACKLNHANACYRLGVLHQEGRALTHDLSLAKEFYGRTCDLGTQAGCNQYKKLNQAGVPSLYSNKNIFQ